MAIADFGGTVLGKKIVTAVADHQNKPDIGAAEVPRVGRPERPQHAARRLQHRRQHRDGQSGGGEEGARSSRSVRAGASLTNEDCTAYSVHYAYDTTALANGTATAIVNAGGKTWFYLTADYAFGTQLQNAASKVVEAHGGKNLGAVRVPLGAADFSSFLLQAQASGAQVLGLANAGTDFSNSLKAANEFGITKTMKPAALLAFISDINSLGLQAAQGLYLTTGWYWDLNPRDPRLRASAIFAKMNREPTMDQAGRTTRPP